MKYERIVKGKFQKRLNRFVAQVYVEGVLETVHVKNTGRCAELLLPEADVILEVSDNPNRKTKYDLICAYKEPVGWVNIDSQAPNRVVYEWLKEQDFTYIKPEYTYGASRVDFYMEKGEEKYLMEVKGCTLEIDGTGYFPDAPTERGVKHVRELTRAAAEGYHCSIGFVIPMQGVNQVLPHRTMHEEFADALELAVAAGVQICYFGCRVTEETLVIDRVNYA